MTPKAKRLTAKEIIKILLKHDFEEVSQTGSHIKFFNIKIRKNVIVLFHQGKKLAIGTLKAIENWILFNYEDAGASTETF